MLYAPCFVNLHDDSGWWTQRPFIFSPTTLPASLPTGLVHPAGQRSNSFAFADTPAVFRLPILVA
jgi:hypothetical protein